ncbi:MAG: LysR family transcriptional regulator [Blautia sp.]|uniref:LysR family transcriptional regulator n=1 Tax=Blautia sp. TaxID=1955243 RepID=UPI0025BB082B|nr:LysR family transcriptional regulator [Blautia sp.]MCI6303630.1 LysR family transcriptional regulator [Blautia sp.]MCI7449953.1 LysR family transcriptional regulator [Blautia sp.]MDY4117043.1 LysR family transcriptional regulator [Blautia sp.]
MEIRQLQTFVQAAQLESFSKTAEMLGYSQSAITVQMRLLETELNTRLFDRMGKRVVLTPQGREFLKSANKILYEVNKASKSMNEDRELTNPLHVGTIESLCTAKFPRLLSEFHSLHPRVNLQITVDSPEKLIRMMEHNELDLIYILDTPRWDENWVKVMELAEPVVFVASAASRFAGKERLVLDDILQEPFFLTEKHANYRQALDQQLALRRQSISPVLEISDTEFIIRMLELNQGLSFLPYFAVEQDIYKHRIITLDVKDVHISMYRQIFYHKNKFRTREMEEFIRLADKRS